MYQNDFRQSFRLTGPLLDAQLKLILLILPDGFPYLM